MKSKALYIIAIFGCLSIVLLSCKKEKDMGMAPVAIQNIKGVAGYGAAIFSWDAISKNPTDSANFLYTSISYADGNGTVHEYKFSRYTTTATIEGLDNKAYTFTIKTVGPQGAETNVTTLSLTPQLPAYLVVSKTLAIEASIGSARISWSNNTGKTVAINAYYTNTSGALVSKIFTSDKINDAGYIGDLPSNTATTIFATVSDISGKKSSPVSVSITPSTEVKLSNSGWTIAGFSDQENGGEGPVNGYATAAIDGDVKTFWHTQWDLANPPYPHWIAINLGKIATVSKVGLVNRQNNSSGQTEIQLMGSLNGTDWTDLGIYPFQQINAEQTFNLTPQKWQYIKVILTKGPDYYGFLGEVYLYGAQ